MLSIVASGAALIAVRKQHEAQYQSWTQALQAQSRLLTEAAAQRLKDSDVAGAQGIILEVLTNPAIRTGRIRRPPSVCFRKSARPTRSSPCCRAMAISSIPLPIRPTARASSPPRTTRPPGSGMRARALSSRCSPAMAIVVDSAAYSPDGTRIVTASDDKTARIWDARTGAQLAVLSGHGDTSSPPPTRPTARASSPPRMTRPRASGMRARARSSRCSSGHDDLVDSAAYSPDGTRIVTASNDKTARIWDARTGAQLAVLSGHGDIVYSAAYSPDGTRIVTASRDKTARIWDARTGAQLAVLSGHGDHVDSAAYSPDGTRIVTASDDKTARIWDAAHGAQLAVLSGHGDLVEFRRLLARRHTHRHRIGRQDRADLGCAHGRSARRALRPWRYRRFRRLLARRHAHRHRLG